MLGYISDWKPCGIDDLPVVLKLTFFSDCCDCIALALADVFNCMLLIKLLKLTETFVWCYPASIWLTVLLITVANVLTCHLAMITI